MPYARPCRWSAEHSDRPRVHCENLTPTTTWSFGTTTPTSLNWSKWLTVMRPGARPLFRALPSALPGSLQVFERIRSVVKELDQVVRDRIAPVLVPAGFRRRGRRFVHDGPLGRVVITARSFSLGRHDAEFHVEVLVSPLVHVQFCTWRDGPDNDGFMVQCRIDPDPRPGDYVRSWGFDLDDRVAGERLSEKMADELSTITSMLDPDVLLAALNGPALPHVGSMYVSFSMGKTIVKALLMSAHGHSHALDAELRALEDIDPDHPAIELISDVVNFIRSDGGESAVDGAPVTIQLDRSLNVEPSATIVIAAVDDTSDVTWIGEPADVATRLASGRRWLVATFDHDVFRQHDAVLERLVEQTGRPAILGQTITGDFLGFVGLCPDGSRWSGAVDPDAAARMREEGLADGYDDAIPAYDTPEAAPAGAATWARAAGNEPDRGRLRVLFAPGGLDRPAYLSLDAFLEAIGLAEPR